MNKPAMNYALWTVQGLLALLFLFGGGMKLVMPAKDLTAGMPLPALLMRFVGVIEILGGLGLILPWLLKIRPGLTPLAACGLAVLMICATVLTVIYSKPALASIPLITGGLAAFVAYGRSRPVQEKFHRSVDREGLRSTQV